MSVQRSLTLVLGAIALTMTLTGPADATGGGRGGIEGGDMRKSSGSANGFDSGDKPLSSARKGKLSFEAIDTNHDGELTPEELTAASKRFPQLMAKDGLIKFYSSIDANQDGAITKPEFTTWLSKQKKAAPTAQVNN